MTAPLARQDKIATSPSLGLVLDDRGLMLGPKVIAWRENGVDGEGRYRIRPAAQIAQALRLAYGEAPDDVIVRCARSLQRVVDLLKEGDEALAGVQTVLAQLPAMSPEGLAKLAASQDLQRAGEAYLTEDRIAADETGAGEWTDGGGGAAASSASTLQVADQADPTQAKKAKFVKDYLGYAQVVAARLHVPVENVLGISALESNWGDSRIAKDGRNFFGMYAPAPRSHWSLPALEPMGPHKKHAPLAGYDSIQESFASFADKYANLLNNKRDPVAFATALQQQAKFGIDTRSGKPVADYIPSLAATIRGLRSFVGERRT